MTYLQDILRQKSRSGTRGSGKHIGMLFVVVELQKKFLRSEEGQLAELMIEYNLGVTTTKTYEIKRIDSDYFNKDA